MVENRTAEGELGDYFIQISPRDGKMGEIGRGCGRISTTFSGKVAGSLPPTGAYELLSGKAPLTALNALRTIRLYDDDDVASGRFDNITLCQAHSVGSIISDDIRRELPETISSTIIREKAFTAMELTLMLRIAGFSVEHIWGGTAGNWGSRPLLMDEIELMVLARLDKWDYVYF